MEKERIIAAFPGASGKVENGIVHYQLTQKKEKRMRALLLIDIQQNTGTE